MKGRGDAHPRNTRHIYLLTMISILKMALAVTEALYRTSSHGPNSDWELIAGVRDCLPKIIDPFSFQTKEELLLLLGIVFSHAIEDGRNCLTESSKTILCFA